MSKLSPARDRVLRIELLRARAAMERQSVVHGVNQLGESLTPRGLLESFMPRGRRKPSSDMFMGLFSFPRRYPLLLSLGSALLSSTGRRRLRWWKLAAGAVLAWRVSRTARR